MSSDKSAGKKGANGSGGGKNNNNSQNSTPEKRSLPSLTDFKLTIFTNTILIAIIGYLIKDSFIKSEVYRDCSDYYAKGLRKNGVYTIRPGQVAQSSIWSLLGASSLGIDAKSNEPINVYCDLDAGGLTYLFRKHFHSSTEFQVGIETYKSGFGDLEEDFFLGLEAINRLTRDKPRQLVAVLNETSYRYNRFQVLNEFHHYKLIIDEELDRMSDDATLLKLNNTLFSTLDLDFDMAANSNCSSGWHAGWWFTDCFDHTACMTCSYLHSNLGLRPLEYAALLIK